MVDDSFSCIKEVTRTVHIALPSLYISNEIAGVSEILESWKRQYSQQLQGVVVSYKNVSLESNSGFIVIDKPFVHYNVKATFELFCPNIGSIVKGKINRVSHDYVGCLVHNTINVAIKLYDNAPEELSNFLALDRMILLKITCFDFHRRVIRVKGEITDECIKLMKESPSFNTPSNIFKNSRSTYYSSDLSDDEASIDNKKISEENEDSNHSQSLQSLFPQTEDSDVFNCDHLAGNSSGGDFHSLSSHDSDSTHASPKKKSVKAKDVKVKTDCTITDSEAMEIDSPPDHKEKKKKKGKDKKLKSKPVKEAVVNHHSKSPGKKKKTKDKSLSNNTLPDNKLVESSKKKGSSKKRKSKNQLLNSSDKLYDSSSTHDDLSSTSIKEEITTDSGYPSPISSSKKIKKERKSLKKELPLDENNIESIIETLSLLQPNLEDQLATSTIKEEPKSDKKTKKRKHDSSHKDDRPLKKKKKSEEGENSLKEKKRDKTSKKVKSKKKDKTSKKDKKKKSKDKSSKSKKDKLSYKIKLKKGKKNKDKSTKNKKLKKSSKEKDKVPES